MTRSIDYGNLMHRAMRGLIRNVLVDIAQNGLPGEHHFFITFDTTHEDVQMAQWLSERYPSDMTVVVQHWYENLDVGEDGFSITLNFGDAPEPLYIPYDAIRTFVDPSVEFGLRFETQDEREPTLAALSDEDEKPDTDSGKAADGAHDAEVVSLDSFRK